MSNQIWKSVFQNIRSTIRDFILKSFGKIGIIVEFSGVGINETAKITGIHQDIFVNEIGETYLEKIKNRIGETVVKVDSKYFRPTEVELLIGDATKARTKLSWEPRYDLDALIDDMMQSDIKEMKKEAYVREAGYRILNYFE